MNDFVKQQFNSIIAQQGLQIVQEPKRVKAYLMDLCPTAKRQVRALLMVLDEGYAKKILQDNAETSSVILLHRFSSLLHDDVGLDLSLAQWAVQTWIEALFPKVVVTIPTQAVTEQPTPAPKPKRKRTVKPKSTPAPTIAVQDIVPDWMQRLWDWADKHQIPDLHWEKFEDSDGGCWKGLPRTKDELINLKTLNLAYNRLTNLPSEIAQLTNLILLFLDDNPLTPQAINDVRHWLPNCNIFGLPEIKPTPSPTIAPIPTPKPTTAPPPPQSWFTFPRRH